MNFTLYFMLFVPVLSLVKSPFNSAKVRQGSLWLVQTRLSILVAVWPASAQKACLWRTPTLFSSPPPLAARVSSLLKRSRLLPRTSSSRPRNTWDLSSSTCRVRSLSELIKHAIWKENGLAINCNESTHVSKEPSTPRTRPSKVTVSRTQ